MSISKHFEEEKKWYRTRILLKKGYQRVFCSAIRRRISWDWIKADTQWKANFRLVRDQAHYYVSDQELTDFLIKQNLKVK